MYEKLGIIITPRVRNIYRIGSLQVRSCRLLIKVSSVDHEEKCTTYAIVRTWIYGSDVSSWCSIFYFTDRVFGTACNYFAITTSNSPEL